MNPALLLSIVPLTAQKPVWFSSIVILAFGDEEELELDELDLLVETEELDLLLETEELDLLIETDELDLLVEIDELDLTLELLFTLDDDTPVPEVGIEHSLTLLLGIGSEPKVATLQLNVPFNTL